jgi:hypothetical protein
VNVTSKPCNGFSIGLHGFRIERSCLPFLFIAGGVAAIVAAMAGVIRPLGMFM